ncbi:MAG: biopolymer transporter ExbD [Alkalimonas sp.]|nr:biopolymer transporter ExbD [Alkalimonas sp.]
MHFPEPRPDQTEARILPLINVVFLLLIFFMIAGSLTVSEPFEVLPPSSASEGVHEQDSVLILLGRDGQLALDHDSTSEAELLRRLEVRLTAEPGLLITLKADGQLPGNQLVRFTQALHGIGVQKLHLLTEPVDQ